MLIWSFFLVDVVLDALNMEVVQPGRFYFLDKLGPCALDVRKWNFSDKCSGAGFTDPKEKTVVS